MDIRSANIHDASELQTLYAQLHTKDPVVSESAFRNALALAIDDPQQDLLVVEVEGQIIATCSLHILANLTRGCRPFGVIENVVTDKSHNRRGFGRKLLAEAVDRAKRTGCYKAMLLTGSKREEVLAFYEASGFKQSKTGFQIRF